MRSAMSRRAFVTATAAAAIAVPRINLGAQTLPKVRISTVSSDGGALPFYAVQQGFFTRNGVDAEVATMPTAQAALAALAGGSIDLAAGNISTIASGTLSGAPFTVVADCSLYVAKTPTTFLCVGADSPIKSPKDLAGKKIALNGLRNIAQACVQQWFANNGVDSSGVSFIEMSFAVMAELAATGKVDAVMVADPVYSQAKTRLRVIGTPYDVLGRQFSLNSFGANSEWVAKNRETAHRTLIALQQTAVWANANPQLSGRILESELKMSPAVIAAMTRAMYPTTLDVSNLQSSLDVMAKYGYLPKRVEAASLITRV